MWTRGRVEKHWRTALSELVPAARSPRPAYGERSDRIARCDPGEGVQVYRWTNMVERAPHPNPLPVKNGETEKRPHAESQRSCQLVEPQRGVLEWLRAFAVITVTKICSIGIQTGSSVFTSLTNSA
jgi:hypothetical protein